jgi:two-component system, NtrC family, sensor histidine kinase GlrK
MDFHTTETHRAAVFDQKSIPRQARRRLSIFWRLAIGSLTIILMVGGVNIYALLQLREVSSLSGKLVSYHTPAIETGKRLLSSLDAQLRSDKKYLVVRDPVFLKNFDEESEEFERTLATLTDQETSPDGRRLLQDLAQVHRSYRRIFRGDAALQTSRPGIEDYERRREVLMNQMAESVDGYISLHEASVSVLVNETRVSSEQAEAIMQRLVIMAIFLGLAMAGVASYSILRPLRRVQEHIRQIGQGRFGASVDVEAPSDLSELVETVNWMGQKLQELDNMKAEFLANISHELRTPLASIREGTQLLLDEIPGPLSQTQRETLRIMKESSDRLILLISTLLDLSKMEVGLMEYRIAPTDLARVLQGSLNKIKLLAEGRHIQIVTEAPEEGVWLPMDGGRMEQVFDNLLSNALKFSPEGAAVHLRVETGPKQDGVTVSVADSGPGIPPEDLPFVFERFYQGRAQTRSTVAGSGLGLALARNVVQAHGGRIWVESQVGKGTTFWVWLPLKPPPRPS